MVRQRSLAVGLILLPATLALALCGAIGGCERAPTAPSFTLTEEEWTYGRRTGKRLVTDHFEIWTTLDDAGLVEFLPTFLESAYQQYHELIPLERTEAQKLHTYLFATRAEWDRFTREHSPARYPVYARISAGGYAERNRCVVYYLRRMYTLSVVAHEGFHQYLGAHFADRIPAWLNEGCACYCETFQFKNDLPVFTPTKNALRGNSLREALAGDTLLPLRELLATDAGKVIVQSQSRKTKTYYAQAWALVCMLRDGPKGKYREDFDRMCADVGTRDLFVKANAAKIAAPHPSETSFGEAVFRAYITNDLDAFEREYHQYLRKLAAF